MRFEKPKRIMRPQRRKDGYLQLSLSTDDGQRVSMTVHKIVLLTFIGKPPGEWTSSHLNGRGDDNRLVNLAWEELGRNVKRNRHHSARLTDDGVRAIRTAHASGTTIAALAREYDVTPQAIRAVVQRKTWKHIEDEAA
jgi:hypothetical protein